MEKVTLKTVMVVCFLILGMTSSLSAIIQLLYYYPGQAPGCLAIGAFFTFLAAFIAKSELAD